MVRLRPIAYGVLVFAVVLAMIGGITWAAGAEYRDAPEVNNTVTNESVTADPGNTTTVDAPSYALRYQDNETITNSTGTQLQEGTDYEWNTSTGEITWFNTDSVSDGEQMTVDYTYVSKSETSRSIETVISIPIEIVLPWGLLLVTGMAVVGMAVGIGGLSSRSSGRGSSFNRR